MNIDFEIEELKKEYNKALKELHELLVLFNPHYSEDATFESAMERLIGNQLTEDEENLLFDILKANKSIKDLDIRIKKLESKRDYDNQVWACYRAYITQQENRRMMDDGDESVKCFERYIPDEVETGYFATEEDRIIAEQTYACYKQFETHQEENEKKDIIDNSVMKYTTYIPDEVETGYIPVGKVEEQHGIKLVNLKGKPIGRQYKLPLVKTVPSYKMVPLEQDIKRSCEQRAGEESIQRDRYRN